MTKQFLINGLEREYLLDNEDNDCTKCKEPITNPLCHNCLGKGIETWLSFYPNIKKKIMPKIKTYIREVNNVALASISCVSCKNKKAALCPYCFTEGVFHILKKNKVDKSVIGDFTNIFNFDLEHKGYIADAEKDGMY